MQKIVVVIPDGMADYKIDSLGGRTPMEAAHKPAMDRLASEGTVGLVKTIPDGMVPESDTAALSILGYDPRVYSKGRSPLEAVSMGLEMREGDLAIRCNLVTLSEDEDKYENRRMLDNGAGEISNEEARALMEALDKALGSDRLRFFAGMSYRNTILWENAPEYADFTRPHDIIGREIRQYLPSGTGEEYASLTRRSWEVLHEHPINRSRIASGKNPANSIWLWSPGKRMELPSFKEKHGLSGVIIAAVPLLKGIGTCARLKIPSVEGATGNFYTDYAAKGKAALAELEAGADFVLVHIEAPDECAHQGELEQKIQSIGYIDEKIIAPIFDYLRKAGEPFKMLVMPDHPTSTALRTHTPEPVPFLVYDSVNPRASGVSNFNEDSVARASSLYVDKGHELLERIVRGLI